MSSHIMDLSENIVSSRTHKFFGRQLVFTLVKMKKKKKDVMPLIYIDWTERPR